MESANKYEVQVATDRLSAINEDKVLKVEELRAANAMNIEGMKDFVKNNRKEPPKAPEATASHEAMAQYQMDLGAYKELKGVLDSFDAQISSLKANYESSKDNLKEATKEELAKLESTLGIAKPAEKKPEGTAAPVQTEKKEESAPAAKAETVVPAAPATQEAKEAPKAAEYVVAKGDTLGKIAKAHGTTVEALAKENGITNVNKIREGQKLKVPAKAEAPKVEDGAAAKAAEAKPATKGDKPAEAGKPEAAKGDKPKTAAAKPESSADKPAAEAKPAPKPGEAQPTSAAATPETAKAPDKKPGGISYQEVAGAKLKTPTAGGDSQKA